MTSTPKAVLALAKGEGSQKLSISYKGKDLAPGEHVKKADAPEPPVMKLTGGSSTGKYLAVAIDLDAPYESFNALSPILHLIQTELAVDATGLLVSAVEPTASWIQPAPPPFSGPHRYVMVVYEQPETFDKQKLHKLVGHPLPLTKRIRFDLPAFIALAGLGAPVAANYFTSN